jgi:Sec-independent protein translocase protein TatA
LGEDLGKALKGFRKGIKEIEEPTALTEKHQRE